MDKLLKYLMFVLMSVAVVSCGGDDKDEPDNPKPPTSYEVKTTTLELGNTLDFDYIDNRGIALYAFTLRFDKDGIESYRVVWGNPQFANYGKVSSLSSISNLKNVVWEDLSIKNLPLEEGNGYVAEGSWNGLPYYIKFYIKSINKSSSGKAIGVTVQSQQFIPSN